MAEDPNHTTEVSNNQLLAWLHDAGNDLGGFADIVNSVAAHQGMTSQAQGANAISHNWIGAMPYA